MKLLDGKLIAEQIRTEIAAEVKKLLDGGIPAPHLAAVLVGDDPASHTYVSNKERACREVGFLSSVYRYPANLPEKQLLEVIDFLNNDPDIDGFIVQLPLPRHIDEQRVIERIDPQQGHQATVELNLKDFFGHAFHGGGRYTGTIRCAYNPFTAVTDADSRRVYWFVDAELVGTSGSGETLFWSARPGTFLVRAVDDQGRAAAPALQIWAYPN